MKMLVHQALVHASWRGLRCTVVHSVGVPLPGFEYFRSVSGDYQVELVGWLLS